MSEGREQTLGELTVKITRTRRGWVVGGIQWPEFRHGVETWILWRKGDKTRVEKIDGKWSLRELDLEAYVDV